MRGAPTDFLFFKIFRKNYLIGPSPIFFEHEAFPNIENWIRFPGEKRNIPLSCSLSSPASPFTSYIHESWTMAKHDQKTTWAAIANLENSLGTWWEPLLLPFPQKTDFLRLFFPASSLHRRRLHPLASLGAGCKKSASSMILPVWCAMDDNPRVGREYLMEKQKNVYLCKFVLHLQSFLLRLHLISFVIQCGSLPILKSVHLGIFKKLELE